MDVISVLEQHLYDEICRDIRDHLEESIRDFNNSLYVIKGRRVSELDPYGEENWEE